MNKQNKLLSYFILGSLIYIVLNTINYDSLSLGWLFVRGEQYGINIKISNLTIYYYDFVMIFIVFVILKNSKNLFGKEKLLPIKLYIFFLLLYFSHDLLFSGLSLQNIIRLSSNYFLSLIVLSIVALRYNFDDLLPFIRQYIVICGIFPIVISISLIAHELFYYKNVSTGGERILGTIAIHAIGPALFAIIILSKNHLKMQKNFLKILAFLFIFLLIIIQHRSGWIAFFVAILVYFIYSRKKFILIMNAAIIVTVVILIFTGVSFGDLININDIIIRFENINNLNEGNNYARYLYLQAAFSGIVEHNFLGVGFASSLYGSNFSFMNLPSTHNSFIEVFGRLGILGFLIYLLNLGYYFVLSFKLRIKSPEFAVFFISTGIFQIVMSTFNPSIAHFDMVYFWMLYGFVISLSINQENNYALYPNPRIQS